MRRFFPRVRLRRTYARAGARRSGLTPGQTSSLWVVRAKEMRAVTRLHDWLERHASNKSVGQLGRESYAELRHYALLDVASGRNEAPRGPDTQVGRERMSARAFKPRAPNRIKTSRKKPRSALT